MFNLSFSDALEHCKQGKKIARSGWNGKNMFVCFSPGFQSLPAENFWGEAIKKWVAQNGGACDVLPYLILKTADNKVKIGWQPNGIDLLANDWGILD